jgi:hypothetical protein
MKYLFITGIAILIGCGGGSDSSSSSTKGVFSTWTSRDDGLVYLMQNCTYNTNCQVLFGSAPCSDARGDFTIYIQETNRLGFSNCADSVSAGGADWSISNNILTLTYDSNSLTELFD